MSKEWIERNNMEEAKRLAEEHWEWLSSILKKVYIDAFVHGYKHGVESLKERCIRNPNRICKLFEPLNLEELNTEDSDY